MSVSTRLDSASGLRPVSAFALIAFVIALVAGRVAWLVVWGGEGRPSRVRAESDLPPSWSIHDRDGRPLATFVQRLDLVLSPNAMWQAHTPTLMAELLSSALGGQPTPAALLRAMLPDAHDGVVVASDPRSGKALAFTREQARRVDAWARTGGFDSDKPPRSIDGLWLEEQRDGTWILCWSPAITLSEEMRARHMPARRHNPLAWTRFLADGLARCLMGDAALEAGPGAEVIELERQRDELWRVLLPSTYVCAVRGFDAARAPAVAALLARERVAQHQLSIERDRTREYPAGRDELLGFWGWLDADTATRAALQGIGFERGALDDAPSVSAALASLDTDQQRAHGAAYRSLISRQQPVTGLERASARLLAEPRWDFLALEPARFDYAQHRPVGETARPYFLRAGDASETPRVVTTVDALLQRFVDEKLANVMESHDPAIAMAIVLDVETAAVLAVGARSNYEVAGWPPLSHQYGPGSTFKVAIMAAALESGQVRPGDRFDVGDGRGYNHLGRTVSEAENSRTGVLTAAECLAHSVNAGLVQIGQRVSPEFMRGRLRALHYGEAPVTGLGGERPGYIPPLPWDAKFRQASVSYGYETLVTLWQHAAALSAVVRGGEWRALRVLDAVEQNGRRYSLAAAAPERALSGETCADIRAMLELGAREGTGRPVAGPDRLPDLVVGSKTGTSEKVPGEMCLHVELADQARHWQEKTRCDRACRLARKAQGSPHKKNCMTLSMALYGRRKDSQREVFVLVVVDEPRAKGRFGSDTAGPIAAAILREALGVTAFGQERRPAWIDVFQSGPAPIALTAVQPWAEVDG